MKRLFLGVGWLALIVGAVVALAALDPDARHPEIAHTLIVNGAFTACLGAALVRMALRRRVQS